MKLNMSRIKIPALAALAVLAAGIFRVPAQQTNNTSTATDFSSFVKIISDRNIFDPKRVPLRPFVARPAPKIVNYFALYGTFNYHKGMFAVFDGSSPEYHKVTEVGEKIDGYTVTAVEDHSVKLSSGTNEVSLNIGMQMTRSDEIGRAHV